MAKYNVSKRESKELGIKRVRISGGDSDSKSSSSSSYDKDISDYRDKLLESLKPTSEETELGGRISNVEESRDTGIQHINEKAIEMTPALGQTRNVETRAALEIGNLESRLGRLVQDRQSSSGALSTALGFAVDDRSRQDQLSQYADTQAFQEREYGASQAFQEKQFNESVRQFNTTASRLSKTSDSDDYEKTEKALYSDVDAWKAKMIAGNATWADAWGAIKRDYGLSANTIDDLLGISQGYRKKYDNPI